MNKDMKYYYIYLIKFETGEVYIGSRQSKVPPEQDTTYWGSPITYKHLWEDVNLKKEKFIIKECKSVEELREIEPKLIKAGWEKYGDKCLNRCAAPIFHPEVHKKAGQLGGKKTKELGVGIFGLSKEERSKFGKINGKKAAKISAEKTAKYFLLKSPTGEIVSGKNIRKFCRENELDHRSIFNVMNGVRKSHKGWSLLETEKIGNEAKVEKLSKEFLLKSPTGEIIKGKNIREFCRNNNLKPGSICRVLNGKANHHKGWTLP